MAAIVGRRHRGSRDHGIRRKPVAKTSFALALACATLAGPAAALSSYVGTIDVVSRADGGVLTTYAREGRYWVVGTPDHEYSVRVCNTTGARLLAVMSVDGVNVISGDTASPHQSGYVLDAAQCADIAGWRKSLSRTAAFYFTELPDSYAARTGRPANVGVIGVAFFREKAQPFAWRPTEGKLAARRGDEPMPRQEAASDAVGARAGLASSEGGAAITDADARAAPASPRDEMARENIARAAPAPATKLGTGHGRSETSYTQATNFERESAQPNATLAIHYDRRENLIAMGILPPPAIARSPNPFPHWFPRFTPDPPPR